MSEPRFDYPVAVPPADDSAGVSGSLSVGGVDYEVRVRLASRYSLWIDLTSGDRPPETERCDNLAFTLNGTAINLASSRLLAGNQADYRLVPMTTLYDLEKLFHQGRFDQLDNSARSMPLLLGYKNNINPDFQNLVSRIAYDLSIYKDLFDQLDEEIVTEPEAVIDVLQLAILNELGPRLFGCLDAYTTELKHIDAQLSVRQKGHHGFYLRKQLWDSLMRAPFIRRTNLKPRGYIGDSEMMRMCYRQEHEGDTTFGKLLHYYPVSSTAAAAVRNRREIIPGKILSIADRLGASSQNPVNVLSVACGPSAELTDVFRKVDDIQRIRFTLLDQDELALEESARLVAGIERETQQTINVRCFQNSVRTLLSTQALKDKWGEFDVIYSMGLFDYLTAPVAEMLLQKLFALLAPGGEMIIGNFHVSNTFRCFMDYWLDWPLIYRTEQQFVELTHPLTNAEVSLESDNTGVQMLLTIKKQAD